mgnify:CR=1 FL=1
MDGIEVIRRIRAQATPLPFYIIILTGKGEKGDIITGLEAGADDYLSKPFDAGELKARLRVGRRMLDIQKKPAARITELSQALQHIKVLQGILPICSYCKKIRDDKGYWSQVEIYISQHSQADFSHGICPDCKKKYFPELCK